MNESKVILPGDLEDFLNWLDSVEKELSAEDMLDEEKIIEKCFGGQLGEEPPTVRGRPIINTIPPIGVPGGCTKILYVAFGVRDMLDLHTFYSRIFRAYRHITAICKRATKYVIFHIPYGLPKVLDLEHLRPILEEFYYFIRRRWHWFPYVLTYPAWSVVSVAFASMAKNLGVLTTIKLIHGPRVIIV